MNQERASKVLPSPHISEKATSPADSKSQFAFRVATDITKPEIKKAVESPFSMKVQRVTILNIKGKTKRTARGLDKRSGWKKAYIALQPGQDLGFATSAE